MKNKFLALIIGIVAISGISAAAQTVSTQQDYPSGFKGINVSDYFSVTVKPADYYGADWTIDTALKEYVHVYVRGSELVANVDRQSFNTATRKKYYGSKAKNAVLKLVVYAPKLDSVVVSGQAKVDLSGIDIQTDKFTMDVSDEASVYGLTVNANAVTVSASKKAQVDGTAISAANFSVNMANNASADLSHTSKNVSLQLNGSSSLIVSGDCETLEVTALNTSRLSLRGSTVSLGLNAGGNEIYADELSALDVKVTGSNGSKSYVMPEETLTLELKGGSLVSYGGNPAIDIVSIQNSSVTRLGF